MSDDKKKTDYNRDEHDFERASRIKQSEKDRADRIASNEHERTARIENDEIERRTRIESEVFKRVSRPDKKSYILVAVIVIAVMSFFVIIKSEVKVSPQTEQQILNLSNSSLDVQNKTTVAVEQTTIAVQEASRAANITADTLNKTLGSLITLINETIVKNTSGGDVNATMRVTDR